jgi:hypothetical protein
MELRVVKRGDIDDLRWNSCVEQAVNENPMAYTWFLDVMCPHWFGIIFDDYQVVAPFEIKSFGFLKSVYHSPYIQFQGFYTSNASFTIDIEEVLNVLNLKRWYRFNYCETPGFRMLQSENVRMRKSYILDLSPSYTELVNGYETGHKKNLRRFERYEHLVIEKCNYPAQYTRLKDEMAVHRQIKPISSNIAVRMERLIDLCINKGKGDYFIVTNNQSGKCIGAAFFLNGRKRSIIFSAVGSEGRDTKSAFALVDHFIGCHAGENRILDFAGSSIKGIADFNKGFGAREVSYTNFSIDTFPLIVRKWL